MNTLPVAQDSQTLWTPSTIESEKPRLAKIAEFMARESARGLSSTTILCLPTDCDLLITEIDRRGLRLMTELEAATVSKTFIGMYPARQVHDAETYSSAMKTLFMAYETDFVRRAVDPVNGLPSRLKHLPTLAETKEALEAEKAKRAAIRATAVWMKRETERREREAEESEKWNLTPEQMEARRKQVSDLLKARPVIEEQGQ